MKALRIVFHSVLVTVFAVSVAAPAGAAREKPRRNPAAQAVEVDAAFLEMIGREAPADRAEALVARLRATSLPQENGGAEADVPLFAVLKSTGTKENPRYEVSGISIDIVLPRQPRLRVDQATFALSPSADGHSCRFELSGAPLVATATFQVKGSVEWGVGPLGGDKVEAEYRVAGLPMEALRALAPVRFDPSFVGMLTASGKADGVVGETSSEMAPAEPLRGTFDASVDWRVLGRTAPLSLRGGFAIDDLMVRIVHTRAEWEGLGLDVRGWFTPDPQGRYSLVGEFHDVDAARVAADWQVPAAWTPEARLTGEFTMKGEAGSGRLGYEATAPTIVVPGLGGWSVRVEEPRLKGSLLAVNADVSASVIPKRLVIGGIDLGGLIAGLRWWRDSLTVSTSNTTLWGGDHDGSLSYRPDEHPAFSVSGRVTGAEARDMAASLVPWLGLSPDGRGAATFHIAQDAERRLTWDAQASLTSGRLGEVDLYAMLLDRLAALDPALAPAAARDLLPPLRHGQGTRIDRLFLETVRGDEGFDIGGFYLRARGFQLDADGTCSRDGTIRFDGSFFLPEEVAGRIEASAPWVKALYAPGSRLFVPVTLSGPAASPKMELRDGYADLVARAKRGEAVEAPGAYEARHVGTTNLAKIPGDPDFLEY